MLNSKQRAALKSIASQTDAIFQIGKGGVGVAMVKSISDALEEMEEEISAALAGEMEV